ncbi:hypothetical protein B9T29_03220 [Acinetobacter sp. ANC 3903]|uniref:glycosyltransferase family 2 protein n=1 Tax=Acinetobacter sp. ANC 3903 TaxID=1977883 RepID=UPI000A32ED0D|nr:glycosyltransferase [Acinetobacter sp. ANC 3903]OTG63732.1 hypothetical protein B9T29_03220 [Acinetobacter sp. ANC 3903]
MLLSLIVPIYKVEKYITECLESIITQLPTNVEVILVNDGTPDRSMEIVDKVLDKQSIDIRKKFRVYEQVNKGVSSARNLGVEKSKGEYLAFLDPDDILMPEYFSEILSLIELYRTDIIQFNYCRFFNSFLENISGKFSIQECELCVINNDILKRIFNDNAWYLWVRVYKKKLFNSLKFPVGYNFEDVAVLPFVFKNSQSIYFSNKLLYAYRDRKESITNDINIRVLEKNILSLKYVIESLRNAATKDILFIIPLVHMLRVYIAISYRMGGALAAHRAFCKIEIDKLLIGNYEKSIIVNRGDKMFLNLYKYGVVSFFIVDFLSYSYSQYLLVKHKFIR